jgi:hypothetical protein
MPCAVNVTADPGFCGLGRLGVNVTPVATGWVTTYATVAVASGVTAPLLVLTST